MSDARESLLAGEPGEAAQAFRRAQGAFASAQDSLDSPLLWLARILPIVGRTPEATSALVEAGARSAEAGAILADALEELPGGLSALVPQRGTIPLEPLEAISEPLRRASELLAGARDAVQGAPSTWLLPPVGGAMEEFGPLVEEAATGSHVAANVAGELPAFLGADGTRRYFLGAQNPAELRGTGGIIGSYTIMTAREGRIQLGDFRSVQFLSNASPENVEPPNPDFGRLYEEFGSWAFWPHINRTADFPSAASAIEGLYEHQTGKAIDGVVVVDPFALADLMRVSGPVEVPTVDRQITPENAVEYLTNQAYADLEEGERKEILGEAAKQVLELYLAGSVGGGRLDAPSRTAADKISKKTGTPVSKLQQEKQERRGKGSAPDEPATEDDEARTKSPGTKGGGLENPLQLAAAARALVATAADGHILTHSTDPEVQAAFEAAGISGSLSDHGGDLLGVIGNSGGGNKTDFYVDRSVSYTVRLENDGDATGYATVSLTNHAPTTGEPRTVIGPYNEDFEPGENFTNVTTYCARDCQITGFSQGGEPGATDLDEELNYSRSEALVDLPSGASETLEYSWTLEDVWDDESASGLYRLTVHGQPTIRPTRLRIEVVAPPGLAFDRVSPGMTVEGDRAIWEGEAESVMTFEVRFDTSLIGRIVRFFQQPVV